MLLTRKYNAQLTEINQADVCSLQMWPTEDAAFRLRNGLYSSVFLSIGMCDVYVRRHVVFL